MTIDSNVDDLLLIILDVENYPEWCYRSTSIKYLRTGNNKVYYYYICESLFIVQNRKGYFCTD